MVEKSFPWLAGALGLAVVSGCGGNVVVDGPGGGGGGDGGGTPTITSSTGGTTVTTGTGSTTTTTTTVNPPSYCQGVCKQAFDLGCLMGTSQAECQQGCVQVFQQFAACQPQLKALYDCVIAAFQGGCDIGSKCDGPSQELNDCVGGNDPCQEYGCVGSSDGYCSCDGTCQGDYLVTECKYSADGYLTCYCMVNGVGVATCDQASNGCGVFESCCTEYFF